MYQSLPIPELLDEWLKWVSWVSDPRRDETLSSDLIGWDEFDYIVNHEPDKAWEAILACLRDSRLEPYLGTLAASPLEDLLSLHGDRFIERVESEARSNLKFALLLGGVWRIGMKDDVWSRVQAVRDRAGFDGNQGT